MGLTFSLDRQIYKMDDISDKYRAGDISEENKNEYIELAMLSADISDETKKIMADFKGY